MKLRHAPLVADAKYKKQKKYAEDESDLDEDAVTEHEEQSKACEIEKERGTGNATLKRDKPPEKLVEAIDGLEERIKAFKLQMVDQEAGKEVALGTSKINYLDSTLGKSSDRVVSVRILARSDSSSLLRITAAWCKKYDVPISKTLTIYARTLFFPSSYDLRLIVFSSSAIRSPVDDGSKPRLEVLI